MVSFSYFKKWTLVINHKSSNLVCCGKCESNTRKRSIFGLLIISILYVSLCRPACCLSSSMKWNFSPLPWDDERKRASCVWGKSGSWSVTSLAQHVAYSSGEHVSFHSVQVLQRGTFMTLMAPARSPHKSKVVWWGRLGSEEGAY